MQSLQNGRFVHSPVLQYSTSSSANMPLHRSHRIWAGSCDSELIGVLLVSRLIRSDDRTAAVGSVRCRTSLHVGARPGHALRRAYWVAWGGRMATVAPGAALVSGWRVAQWKGREP